MRKKPVLFVGYGAPQALLDKYTERFDVMQVRSIDTIFVYEPPSLMERIFGRRYRKQQEHFVKEDPAAPKTNQGTVETET